METETYDTRPNTISNGFATAALVCGICSILFVCCGMGCVFGALGILFAALSRGAYKMTSTAKIGLGMSIGGFVLTICICIALLVIAITQGITQYDFSTQQGIQQFYNDFYSEFY